MTLDPHAYQQRDNRQAAYEQWLDDVWRFGCESHPETPRPTLPTEAECLASHEMVEDPTRDVGWSWRPVYEQVCSRCGTHERDARYRRCEDVTAAKVAEFARRFELWVLMGCRI